MARPRRISRGLIGLLLVTFALGAIFYFNNVRRSRASDTPTAPPPQSAQANKPPLPASKPPAPLTTPSRTSTPSPGVRPGGTPGGSGPLASNPMGSKPIPSSPLAPATQPVGSPQRPYTATSTGGSTGMSSAALLADARAKVDAGDLVAARKVLNDALLAGSLSSADATQAKRMLGEMNQQLVLSPKRFTNDDYSASYTVKSGELLRSIAERHEIPWEMLARINGITDPRKLRAGQTLKVVEGPFHAVVTKSRYTLDVYLGSPGERGSLFVTSFPVGLGANDSTPVGSWMVETHKKLKNPTYFSPRGEGVIDAGDPKNPLGERWIGLIGIDGGALGQMSYGIHGTIEPETIGKQASMGCIRMHNEDVELLFDMLMEGKSVVVVRE